MKNKQIIFMGHYFNIEANHYAQYYHSNNTLMIIEKWKNELNQEQTKRVDIQTDNEDLLEAFYKLKFFTINKLQQKEHKNSFSEMFDKAYEEALVKTGEYASKKFKELSQQIDNEIQQNFKKEE